MLASEHKTTTRNKGFDSLAYAKRLETNGFTRQQADEQKIAVEEQRKLIEDSLAARADIELIRADVEKLSLRTKTDIELVRADLATGLPKTNSRLSSGLPASSLPRLASSLASSSSTADHDVLFRTYDQDRSSRD
jgi:hypothetical protein